MRTAVSESCDREGTTAMEVFKSCGQEGWLKVCIDGQVTCLSFKINVQVCVSYTCESDSTTNVYDNSPDSGIPLPRSEEDKDRDTEKWDGVRHIVQLAEGEEGEKNLSGDNPDRDSSNVKWDPGHKADSTSEPIGGERQEGVWNDKEYEQGCSNLDDDYGGNDDDDDNDDDSCSGGTFMDSKKDGEGLNKSEEKDYNPGEESGVEIKQREDSVHKVVTQQDREETEGSIKHTSPGGIGDSVAGRIISLKDKIDPSFSNEVTDKVVISLEGREGESEDGLSWRGRQSLLPQENATGNSHTHFVHKCNICGGEFKDGYSLTTHQRAQYGTERCSECNLEFKSKFHFDMHKQLRHSSDTTIANNALASSSHKQPQFSHSALYRCCICNTVFQNYENFKCHLDYFTKHKQCRKETKEPSSLQDGIENVKAIRSGSVKMKPLSVVLTRLSEQKIDSLSRHPLQQKSLVIPELTSLMNVQIPKHGRSKHNLTHEAQNHNLPHRGPMHNLPHRGRTHNAPTGAPIHNVPHRHWRQQLSKRPVSHHMPVTKPKTQMTIKGPSDQMLLNKRPSGQLPTQRTIRKPSEQMPTKRALDQILIKKPSEQMPTKRPLDQILIKKPSEQMPTKRPLDQILIKKPLEQMRSKRPLDQILIKKPSEQMPTKRPLDQILIKKPSEQMPTKRPLDQIPIKSQPAQISIKRPSIQMSSKRPSDQVPIKRLSDKMPAKRPLDSKLMDKNVKRQWLQSQPSLNRTHNQVNRAPGHTVPKKTPARKIDRLKLRSLNKSIMKRLHQLPLADLMKIRSPVRSLPSGDPGVKKPHASGSAQGESALEYCSIQQAPNTQGHTNLPWYPVKASPYGRNISWHKIWRCLFCEKVFNSKGSYISHKKTSRKSQMCTECGFTSTSEASFLIHQYQKHTNFNNNRYISGTKDLRCHICEEPVTLDQVLNHIMSKHTGECPYECCVCKAPSKDYNDWVSHGKTHVRTPEEKANLQGNKLMLCLSVKMGDPDNSEQVFCNLCKTYFSSEKEFIRHHKPESKSKQCEICKLICHTEAGYMIHKYISHGLSSGENNETTVTADTPPDVAGNLAMWHEDDVANDNCTDGRKCPSCSEMVPMKDLLVHVMNVHTKESLHNCCSCQETAQSLDKYIDHCDMHQGKKPFGRGTHQCLVCDSRFESRLQVTRHRKIVHKSKCLFCNLEFKSKLVLEVHLTNHHSEQMTPCRYCKKLFADKNILAQHERNHFYTKTSTCPTCGVQVKCLAEHMARLHATGDQEFLCNLCGKKFVYEINLKRHLVMHSDGDKYQCEICNKTFKRNKGFQRHARTHLKDPPLYACQICGKKCTQRANLTVHMRIHSSTKAFTCEHCGQGFNYNQSLQSHIRKKHTALDSTISTTTNSNTTVSSNTITCTTLTSTTTPESRMINLSDQSRAIQCITDAIHPTVDVTVTSVTAAYPQHPVYPDPDPSDFINVNTFQQSYFNIINTLARSDQDSSQGNQQQGSSMFYQQF